MSNGGRLPHCMYNLARASPILEHVARTAPWDIPTSEAIATDKANFLVWQRLAAAASFGSKVTDGVSHAVGDSSCIYHLDTATDTVLSRAPSEPLQSAFHQGASGDLDPSLVRESLAVAPLPAVAAGVGYEDVRQELSEARFTIERLCNEVLEAHEVISGLETDKAELEHQVESLRAEVVHAKASANGAVSRQDSRETAALHEELNVALRELKEVRVRNDMLQAELKRVWAVLLGDAAHALEPLAPITPLGNVSDAGRFASDLRLYDQPLTRSVGGRGPRISSACGTLTDSDEPPPLSPGNSIAAAFSPTTAHRVLGPEALFPAAVRGVINGQVNLAAPPAFAAHMRHLPGPRGPDSDLQAGSRWLEPLQVPRPDASSVSAIQRVASASKLTVETTADSQADTARLSAAALVCVSTTSTGTLPPTPDAAAVRSLLTWGSTSEASRRSSADTAASAQLPPLPPRSTTSSTTCSRSSSAADLRAAAAATPGSGSTSALEASLDHESRSPSAGSMSGSGRASPRVVGFVCAGREPRPPRPASLRGDCPPQVERSGLSAELRGLSSRSAAPPSPSILRHRCDSFQDVAPVQGPVPEPVLADVSPLPQATAGTTADTSAPPARAALAPPVVERSSLSVELRARAATPAAYLPSAAPASPQPAADMAAVPCAPSPPAAPRPACAPRPLADAATPTGVAPRVVNQGGISLGNSGTSDLLPVAPPSTAPHAADGSAAADSGMRGVVRGSGGGGATRISWWGRGGYFSDAHMQRAAPRTRAPPRVPSLYFILKPSASQKAFAASPSP